MSIERNGAANSPKTVAGAESHGGKGKVKTGDEADASAAGGFLAILTALEPQTDQEGAAAQTQVTTEDQPQMADLPAADPTIALALNFSTDLATLLAQAGEHVAEKMSTVGDPGPSVAKGGTRLLASAIGAEKMEMTAAASASPGGEKLEKSRPSLDGLLEQTTQVFRAQIHKARGAELQADVAARLAESHTLKLSSLVDGMAREPALSGALLTSGIGDGVVRQADRPIARPSFVPAGAGVEGIWGQQAFQAGNRVDAPSAMADSSMLSLESKVADKVSYWVTQGVQNAELTLDGLGGESVKVSISLKGDEAHVGFRTDQPEIRRVLEGAVAHLKDLLISQGLVLSGVFVGTSSQDGAGTQERRSRTGTRHATITTTEAAPAESRPRVNPSVGSAVDLFV